MSKIVKMKPMVCQSCKQTWQVPEYVTKDKPYMCPVCKKKLNK